MGIGLLLFITPPSYFSNVQPHAVKWGFALYTLCPVLSSKMSEFNQMGIESYLQILHIHIFKHAHFRHWLGLRALCSLLWFDINNGRIGLLLLITPYSYFSNVRALTVNWLCCHLSSKMAEFNQMGVGLLLLITPYSYFSYQRNLAVNGQLGLPVD
jgi:hypothetical protein